MVDLNGWNWAILAVAGYVAVVSLVRLMQRHHDLLVGQLRAQIEKESTRPRPRRRRKAKSTAVDDGQKTSAA